MSFFSRALEVAQSISTWYALIAFIVCLTYAYFYLRAYLRNKQIESVPESDRADLIIKTAEKLHIDLSKIPKNERKEVVLAQLKHHGRSKSFKNAIIVLICLFATVIVYILIKSATQLGDLKVFVHGKKGKTDLVIKSDGDVKLFIDGRIPQSSGIDRNGMAIFSGISKDDKFRLGIEYSQKFEPINPDSVYTLSSNNTVYLQVHLKGNLLLTGITSYLNQPLPSTIVKFRDTAVLSDSNGYFKLQLDDSQEAYDGYMVTFIRDGFSSVSKRIYPSKDPVPIEMEKLPSNKSK